MTTPPDQKRAASRRLWRIASVCVICALSAACAYWIANSVFSASHSPLPSRGDLAYDAVDGASGNTDMAVLMSPVGIDPLTLNPARHALDHEPGNLPAYPSGTTMGRYAQADGNLIDEVSHCRVTDAEPAAVQRHYERAARQLGWEPLPKPSGTALSDHSRTYVKPDLPMGTLTVRWSGRPGDLHVTVWLRYAMHPGFHAD